MIRCWFFRRSITRTFENDQPLSIDLESHLLACQDCRHFHESEGRVVNKLRHGVLSREDAAPAFLHRKIMARIERERFESAPRPVSRLPGWSTAAAAALVLSIGFFTVSVKFRSSHTEQTGSKAAQLDEYFTANNSRELPIRLPAPGIMRQLTMHLDQPLETELQAMLQDAQSAIHLLAHNFLPENVVKF